MGRILKNADRRTTHNEKKTAIISIEKLTAFIVQLFKYIADFIAHVFGFFYKNFIFNLPIK
ncbi:hypothetical protein AZE41_11385 [Sporosarcina psychrophila]|nr:hypothetical protein AZE41_11385 [Sporosarcina psychrophila]